MRKTFIVAKMMFRLTAMNKAFVITTIIGPFLIGAVAVLPGLLSAGEAGAPERIDVGIVDSGKEVDENVKNRLYEKLQDSPVVLRDYSSPEKARTAAQEKEVSGFLFLDTPPHRSEGYTYYSRSGADITAVKDLENALVQTATELRLEELGLDRSTLDKLQDTPQLSMKKIGREDESSNVMAIMFTGIAFVMLLYMTILLYGQMIGRSVVREKTENTVEIMLSSLKPRQLMFGKIFGIGAAGLLQYAVWFAMAALIILTLEFGFTVEVPGILTPHIFAVLLLFFLPAFLLYSSAFAALAAASEDEQHLGQIIFPLILFLIIPLVLITPIIINPSGSLSIILSFFPFTAPIVMFIRVLIETPPLWQPVLSYGLMIATIAVIVRLGGKIFQVGILFTGKRPSLTEVFRWIKSG